MAWQFEQLRALQGLAARVQRAETLFLQRVVPAVKFPESDKALASVHGGINSIVASLRHEAGTLRTSINQARDNFERGLPSPHALSPEHPELRTLYDAYLLRWVGLTSN